MQAKQRRERHFRSSVGLMLNENHGFGYTASTVQHQDFVHKPSAFSLPSSAKALEFLINKFPVEPRRQERCRAGSSSSASTDLFHAYRNVTGQPVGMVHYDRDPYYWPGKERPLSAHSESIRSNLIRSYDYIFNGGRDMSLITPDTDKSSRASTTTPITPTINSKRGFSASSGRGKRAMSNYKGMGEDPNQVREKVVASGTNQFLKSELLAVDAPSDKGGFKPYSPFAGTSPDFEAKEGRRLQHSVAETGDIDNSTPLPAPKYSDALNNVLDLSSADVRRMTKHTNQRPADVLKIHGNPQYPSAVIDDKDVPNYVAWAKIYPYCPLTQKEGEDKPVFVPPRGFTPSTPSRPSTKVKLRDIKKTKRNIMEGIKLLSSSSRKRQQQQQQQQQKLLAPKQSIQKDTNVVNPEISNTEMKKNNLLGKNTNTRRDNSLNREAKHIRDVKFTTTHHNNDTASVASPTRTDMEEIINKTPSPTSQAYRSIMHDVNSSRKILDLKMRGGDTWYGGKTPSRTPSPDSRLHIPTNRAWVKHYSPARVQRFLASVAKPNNDNQT